MKTFMSVFILVILFAIIIYLSGEKIYPYITYIKGEVTIKEEFLKDLAPNAMLHITLCNEHGIIFAVKKVINPVFPVNFKITYKNILYPEIITGKCMIRAILNYEGSVDEIKPGTLYSQWYNSHIIDTNITIYLDRKK